MSIELAVCPACNGGGANVFFVSARCHVCEGWRVVRVPPIPDSAPRDDDQWRSIRQSQYTPSPLNWTPAS